ncbi:MULTISPECIES: ABC transporter substrate-binding protein [Thiomicrorhabdus]|uniref:ABC transporter substrate-binding protein n=1 Tax=Thiomicrorhabdus heinhorstiae TaxID=2748010 RepID=A0ABS0BZR6_9GAMM|nr:MULTISPECIES: ABC transporter substrate-binding protein [Thiomicrorhabdus]MBF6058484.1 ABC transporter substrate-binding protein [Thiomicrorhabdus heinhorstiae]
MCQYCSPDNPMSHEDYVFNPQKGRREFILDSMAAAGGMAAMGGLSLMPSQAMAADEEFDEVVRIGYLPITDASALLVAHAKGFFEDEGLKVEKPTLIRGWSPLIEGFAAHKFNLVHFLKPIPVWMRYNNNFPVTITGWAHTNGSGLVVGKHTGVEKFEDLGGKQIAVPYWYSMHNIVLQMALKNAGLEPVIQDQTDELKPNQVNLQIMPPPDMPPALAAKKIDAYIVAEPFNAFGEMKAGAKMLRFTGDIWKNHPCCVVCMHDEHVQKRKEWSQKVMNAVVRGAVYAQENKAEVAKLLSRDGMKYLPMPEKAVLKAMTDYDPKHYAEPDAIEHEDWKVGRIDFNPYPYPSATKFIVDQLKETLVTGDTTFLKELDTDFVTKDLVNYEYVKNAMDKFGVWDKVNGVDPANPTERVEVFEL